MTVRDLVEVLGRLDQLAKVDILLDDQDIERGEGIYEPLVLPDDGDDRVFINIGRKVA